MNRYEMNICPHVSKLNELQASKKKNKYKHLCVTLVILQKLHSNESNV